MCTGLYENAYVSGSTFYQQKLTAWRPDFTSSETTLRLLKVVGVTFVIIGLVILYTTSGVRIQFELCTYATAFHPVWLFFEAGHFVA